MKRRKKTILYLLLLFIATSFFVTSVNLYHNSIHNLKVSEETFSTLAVIEIYGEVDKYGELVKPNSEEHIGYQAVGVKGYDVRDILDSKAVESYDLRSHYGAYIEGHPAMWYNPIIRGEGKILITGLCEATMLSDLRFRHRNRLYWTISWTIYTTIEGDSSI